MSKLTIEQVTWSVLQQAVFYHMRSEAKEALGVRTLNDITHTMRTDVLFDRHDHEENLYRFSTVLTDLYRYFIEHYDLPMKITYKPNSEYYVFPTLESIWCYFVEYVDILEKEMVPN